MILEAQHRARRIVSSIVAYEDVDDILQNAALKAFQHDQQFRGESEYRTWFYRIAYNEALVHLRSLKAKCRTWEQLDDPDILVGGSKTPEAIVIEQQQCELLYAAIARLTPKLREAAWKALMGETVTLAREKTARFHMKRKLREILTNANISANSNSPSAQSDRAAQSLSVVARASSRSSMPGTRQSEAVRSARDADRVREIARVHGSRDAGRADSGIDEHQGIAEPVEQ